jgi:hypothetical protein
MQFSFDATGIDTSDDRGGFEPLPQGKYNAMVIESAVKDSKSGGQYLELVCQVLDGAHVNRKIWHRLNIVNDNPVAENIARKDLAVLMINLGLPPQMVDTQELHGKPFSMGLKIRPAEGEYPAKNEVSFTGPAKNQPTAAPMVGRPTPPLTATVAAPPWG